MMNTKDNDYVSRARVTKAHKLVDAIVSVGGTRADLDLEDFPWDDAAKAAGINRPSDETKDIVRRLLDVIEDVREKHSVDPLEGL